MEKPLFFYGELFNAVRS